MDADKARAGLTGGCQCGAVRYRLDAAPRGVERLPLPHVPEGRRRPVHGLRRRAAEAISSSRAARSPTFVSSDIAERGFCADCGTPLTYRGPRRRARQRDDRQPRRPERRRAGDPARRRIARELARRRRSRFPPMNDTTEWLARKKISAIRRQPSAPRSRNLRCSAAPDRRKGDQAWPKPSSTITFARRAGAASRTARCTPPRRCIWPRPR